MTPRHVLAAGFLLAATASVAQAQAPGEVLVVAPPAPVAQPAYVVVAPPQQVDPMRHRFSIGLNMGGLNLGEEDNEFSIAELAIRYRLNRRIELELSSFGGTQTTGDYYYDDSYDATGSLAIGARYRFLPERKLNWYASAAIGGAIVAPHDADDDTLASSQRGLFMLGIGGEWRFRPHWALQAEARLVSLSPTSGEESYDARVSSDGIGGGMFTFGLSIYL